MSGPAAGGEIVDNPAPAETAWREVAKRAFWRLLPEGAYQRLLAYSKARDFTGGRFREPELDLIDSLVKPGSSAVDVGANHGMWTLALSRAVGAEGRVYSFEPVPFTFGVLSAVARRSGFDNVALINKGCSDRAAAMEMTVPLQRSGSSDDLQAHLSARGRSAAEDGRSATVLCEVTTLDAELAELAELDGIALLKLDIEGAELLALKGATDLIAAQRPAIVCEVDVDFLRGFDQEPGDVVSFLARWDYLPHIYEAGRRRLERIEDPARIGHANVVFLTEAQRALLKDFGA